MIAGTGLRTALTVLFAAAALYGLRLLLRPCARSVKARAADTVDGLLHTAMALCMAVMVWPAGMDVPALPQTVLFSAATLWFASRAVLHRHDRPGDAAHAVMSAGMAWMVTAMAHAMTSGHSPAGPDTGGSTAASGTGHGSHHAADGGTAAMSLTDGVSRGLTLVLAAACVAIAWWWLARAFDTARIAPRRPEAVQHTCHGGMGAGTAVMLFAMI